MPGSAPVPGVTRISTTARLGIRYAPVRPTLETVPLALDRARARALARDLGYARALYLDRDRARDLDRARVALARARDEFTGDEPPPTSK